MNTDNGVDALNRLSADREAGSAITISLGNSAMDGIQAIKVLLEARAEGGVESITVTVGVSGIYNDDHDCMLTLSSRECHRQIRDR